MRLFRFEWTVVGHPWAALGFPFSTCVLYINDVYLCSDFFFTLLRPRIAYEIFPHSLFYLKQLQAHLAKYNAMKQLHIDNCVAWDGYTWLKYRLLFIQKYNHRHTVDTLPGMIYECASDPCSSQGTCVDQAGSFYCACAPGYTGITCSVGECNRKHRPR